MYKICLIFTALLTFFLLLESAQLQLSTSHNHETIVLKNDPISEVFSIEDLRNTIMQSLTKHYCKDESGNQISPLHNTKFLHEFVIPFRVVNKDFHASLNSVFTMLEQQLEPNDPSSHPWYSIDNKLLYIGVLHGFNTKKRYELNADHLAFLVASTLEIDLENCKEENQEVYIRVSYNTLLIQTVAGAARKSIIKETKDGSRYYFQNLKDGQNLPCWNALAKYIEKFGISAQQLKDLTDYKNRIKGFEGGIDNVPEHTILVEKNMEYFINQLWQIKCKMHYKQAILFFKKILSFFATFFQ